ncbi:hypothetical protein THIARS_70198 [Thiomonas delicata]|uniref:Uncharacterized protein n=1 Tax=Thiomonas delicata TaxID=364030 RepID=A0A238D5H7_THIDL|nr:hypothetical protein THIARS_70198 [Thiomonas delicata]
MITGSVVPMNQQVDLNEGLGPILLARVLLVDKAPDVVSANAREAARELFVLANDMVTKVKNVQSAYPFSTS